VKTKDNKCYSFSESVSVDSRGSCGWVTDPWKWWPIRRQSSDFIQL